MKMAEHRGKKFRRTQSWAWRHKNRERLPRLKDPSPVPQDPDAGLARYLAPTSRHIAKLVEEENDE
jgi:hypothetical protein